VRTTPSDLSPGENSPDRVLKSGVPRQPTDSRRDEPLPIKDPNPPEAEVEPPRETPKVGSRDAPGG